MRRDCIDRITKPGIVVMLSPCATGTSSSHSFKSRHTHWYINSFAWINHSISRVCLQLEDCMNVKHLSMISYTSQELWHTSTDDFQLHSWIWIGARLHIMLSVHWIIIVPADCFCLSSTKPRPAPMFNYCELDYSENIFETRLKHIFLQDNWV